MRTLIFIFASLLAVSSQAREITVNSDGPADFSNIQAAIDDSNNGDVIIVAESPGYVGDGNRDLDFGGKAITVRSTDPNDPSVVQNTIIYCWGDQSEPHRGFNFHSGEGPNSVVAGLTITDGYADNGGGIYCNASSPTISLCSISDNSAEFSGGGIYCNQSSLTISHCTVQDNDANLSGGGIYCTGSGSPTIKHSIIKGNSAETYSGGGIHCSNNSNPTVSNCIIYQNWCKGEHGPILSGPYNGGGGICCRYSEPQIINCSIVGNETEMGRGGGVLCHYDGEIKIDNSIIWNNNAPEGAEIGVCHMFMSSPENPTLTVSYSDVKGGQAGAFNFKGTINWQLGNIDAAPLFADPCNGDYHLQSTAGRWYPNTQSWVIDGLTSPCIDAGNPGCPLAAEYEDPNNTRINIGAYGGTAQASKTPANWALLADLTNDHKVDSNDQEVFVRYWLDNGQCIPSDLNRNESVDFTDFAIFANSCLW